MARSITKYRELINEIKEYLSNVNKNNFYNKTHEFEILLLQYKNDFSLGEIIEIVDNYPINHDPQIDDYKVEIIYNAFDDLKGNKFSIFRLDKWKDNNDLEKDVVLLDLLKKYLETDEIKYYIQMKEYIENKYPPFPSESFTL